MREGLYGNLFKDVLPSGLNSRLVTYLDEATFGVYGELHRLVEDTQRVSLSYLNEIGWVYVLVKYVLIALAIYSVFSYLFRRLSKEKSPVLSGLFSGLGVLVYAFLYNSPTSMHSVSLGKIKSLVAVLGDSSAADLGHSTHLMESLTEALSGVLPSGSEWISQLLMVFVLLFLSLALLMKAIDGNKKAFLIGLYPLSAFIGLVLPYLVSLGTNTAFLVYGALFWLMLLPFTYLISLVLATFYRWSNQFFGWFPLFKKPRSIIEEEVGEVMPEYAAFGFSLVALFCLGFFSYLPIAALMFVLLSGKYVRHSLVKKQKTLNKGNQQISNKNRFEVDKSRINEELNKE